PTRFLLAALENGFFLQGNRSCPVDQAGVAGFTRAFCIKYITLFRPALLSRYPPLPGCRLQKEDSCLRTRCTYPLIKVGHGGGSRHKLGFIFTPCDLAISIPVSDKNNVNQRPVGIHFCRNNTCQAGEDPLAHLAL